MRFFVKQSLATSGNALVIASAGIGGWVGWIAGWHKQALFPQIRNIKSKVKVRWLIYHRTSVFSSGYLGVKRRATVTGSRLLDVEA